MQGSCVSVGLSAYKGSITVFYQLFQSKVEVRQIGVWRMLDRRMAWKGSVFFIVVR
jgi:hypothetical protein